MQFKSIANNNYTVNLYSNDINLIGRTSYMFQRRVQELSVRFSESLFLGEVIDVYVEVTEPEIFQTHSTIYVSSPYYSIASTITVIYSTNNADLDANESISFFFPLTTETESMISRCYIESEITESQELCSSGIEFSKSNSEILDSTISIQLSSYDTLLVNNENEIYINDCPTGQGLIGSSISSYVCDDCAVDNIGLIGNSECYSCEGITGITCYGSDQLIISYNYWIAINNKNNSYSFNLFDIDHESQQILATFCPAGFVVRMKRDVIIRLKHMMHMIHHQHQHQLYVELIVIHIHHFVVHVLMVIPKHLERVHVKNVKIIIIGI